MRAVPRDAPRLLTASWSLGKPTLRRGDACPTAGGRAALLARTPALGCCSLGSGGPTPQEPSHSPSALRAPPPLLSHHGWQLTSDRPVVCRTLDRAGQPRRPGCLSERETLASLWSLPPRSGAGPAPSRRSSRQAWLALDLTSGLNHPTHQLAAWPVPGPERLQRVIVL